VKRRSFLCLLGVAPIAAVAAKETAKPDALKAYSAALNDHFNLIKKSLEDSLPKVNYQQPAYDCITISANPTLRKTDWNWSEGPTEY
jgi:hypothetical protein